MSSVALHITMAYIRAVLKPVLVVNVGLGTYIFDDGVSDIFFAYVGYISFIIVLFGVMFILFSITTTFVRDPG